MTIPIEWSPPTHRLPASYSTWKQVNQSLDSTRIRSVFLFFNFLVCLNTKQVYYYNFVHFIGSGRLRVWSADQPSNFAPYSTVDHHGPRGSTYSFLRQQYGKTGSFYGCPSRCRNLPSSRSQWTIPALRKYVCFSCRFLISVL